MANDPSLRIIDPEVEDKNEKFSAALMGAASGQIFGLVAFLMGCVGGVMSDQQTGLVDVGIGMGIFAIFSLLHYGISRRWLGPADPRRIQASLAFFGPAFLGGLLYFYATFADTDWPVLGYAGGFLFLFLTGKGVLSLEHTPPRSRKTTYVFSPFEGQSLLIVVLVGSILGVGVGMSSQGHRAIGRGPFARTFLSEQILSARHQADLLLFGLPHSYRLVKALSEARRRGLPVRVLVTAEAAGNYSAEIRSLVSAGVPVRILPVHLPTFVRPMALFDKRILLTGSGGWGSLSPDGGGSMHMEANILSQGRIHASQRIFDTLWPQSSLPATPAPPRTP
ncbi:MAG: phospholipase D family protein [Nitrospirae bacterium]|nr:phospholipase D family protein [Nitrospirota bacterium]MCL5285816.1 phospholipase D family protein [Nitrospirota bacterium]